MNRALGLDRASQPALRQLLRAMVRSGVVAQQGRRFLVNARSQAAAGERLGTLRVNANPRGGEERGLVLLDDTAEEPVYCDGDDMAEAIDGDRVALVLSAGRGRARGRVVRVIERVRRRVTGLVEGPPWRLRADDPRLALRPITIQLDGDGVGRATLETWAAAQPRPLVAADIVAYPDAAGAPLQVVVTRALGQAGELTTEVARVLVEQGVVEPFAAAVCAEAEALPDHVRRADLVDRVDLRDRPFVTIDPETARDFDDAVAMEPGPGGTTRVWVAVADVSHYVTAGSALDEEARRRAFSVYLPDRAIPMLPTALSAGICSLLPQQDRLAMVVRLDVDPTGSVVESDCMAAVIHSRARLDYAGAAAALAGELHGTREAYREHLPQLHALRRVAETLRARRMARGSLDLDLPEPKVVLDADDPALIRDIVISRQDPGVRETYGLIEELMLAANEAVAQRFVRAQQPTLWRVHPAPRLEALQQLAQWLASYSVKLPGAAPTASARESDEARLTASSARWLQRTLQAVGRHRAGRALTYLVLRALKQACYRAEHEGHFGLASAAYLHFTSPIRRYPDLIVHRQVKAQLRAAGKPAGGRLVAAAAAGYSAAELRDIGAGASARERAALDVSRQVQGLYGARLLRERIGDELEGQITGVMAFGVFVALDRPAVDGLVHVEQLPEPMVYDAERLRLDAPGSGRALALGDRVCVRVIGTDLRRGQINLQLVSREGTSWPAAASGRGAGARPRPARGGAPPRSERTRSERTRQAGAGRRRTRG
ncbi:MAG: VacB/RNase II family 3'-5' exoribonuclease [Proteobacteria bacterium]|nr:VacB/RNase II family 3'-5' exoribonuclease [Pseudomonadota bacterium]